nr:MAG TPA: hypothetical protein [Caudoviricetes sp.]DAU94385.1 MAG TPA: hypothetical protein [Caudoviricetes sp.]
MDSIIHSRISVIRISSSLKSRSAITLATTEAELIIRLFIIILGNLLFC